MRVILVELAGASADDLFRPEPWPTLGGLLEMGCHGRLAAPGAGDPAAPLRDAVGRLGARLVRAGGDPAGDGGAACDAAFGAARGALGRDEWDCLHVVVPPGPGGRPDVGRADRGLATLLEALEGEAAVLVVASPGTAGRPGGDADGAFVLAVPGVAAAGECRGVTGADLAATASELVGADAPSPPAGRSLVPRGARSAAATDEEEELMREHLRGLGYL